MSLLNTGNENENNNCVCKFRGNEFEQKNQRENINPIQEMCQDKQVVEQWTDEQNKYEKIINDDGTISIIDHPLMEKESNKQCSCGEGNACSNCQNKCQEKVTNTSFSIEEQMQILAQANTKLLNKVDELNKKVEFLINKDT